MTRVPDSVAAVLEHLAGDGAVFVALRLFERMGTERGGKARSHSDHAARLQAIF